MKKLFQRYGNDILLLDATYRTNKYMYPLFQLCTLTNVGFQVKNWFFTTLQFSDLLACLTEKEYLKSSTKLFPWSFCLYSHNNFLGKKLPLILLLQPVAIFIVEREDTRSIIESLDIIKSWVEVNSPTIVIDHSMPEMRALHQAFPSKFNFDSAIDFLFYGYLFN